jgi:DNA polymerase elongation subunit (family B)
MGEAIRRGSQEVRIRAATAVPSINSGQPLPQEIHKPVVERLRAFTWVADWKQEDKYAYVEGMTTPHLLALLSGWDEKITGERKRAQVVLQKRYIAELSAAIPDWGAWGGPTHLFDTETQNVERGQAMRFGVLQSRGLQYHELIEFMQREQRPPNRAELDALGEVIVFYDKQELELDGGFLERSVSILRQLCEDRERETGIPHRLMTRNEVIKNVLFKETKIKDNIPLPIMIVGHNLGFDLARLPDYDPTPSRGKDMFGGFSLIMGTNDGDPIVDKENAPKPSGWLPRVIMKKIGIGKRRYKCVSPSNGGLYTHIFVDTVQLTKALLGADTPASMDALCEMWGGPIPKERVEHFKPLTRTYADYCYNDVERTWFIYVELRKLYQNHHLTTSIDRIFSVASIGKAYYKEMNVRTFIERNINIEEFQHRAQMLQMCGIAMEGMFGARTECGWRHEVREVINADFRSQYPTINILLGLQDLMLAERIKIIEGDDQGEDVLFLSSVSIEPAPAKAGEQSSPHSLLGEDKTANFATWRRLCGYALVDPAGGVWPKRTIHQDDDDDDNDRAAINVGVNEIEHGPYVWVSYLDILASKFITGTMPRIFKTKRIVPDPKYGRQSDIRKVKLFGDENYIIDLTLPGVELFQTIIEMRGELKAKRDTFPKGSAEYARLDAMQLALKLIANSTSYGIVVQFDVDERETTTKFTTYYGDQSHESEARARTRDETGKNVVSSVKVEKPGRWFAPWGPLITAGGRLLIAIAECLARDEGAAYGGIHYGMCDTDSMAFVRPDGMPRDEFRAAVGRITTKFQRINPYRAINGKEEAVFSIEDINYDFTNEDGLFKIVKPKVLKPLYILSISAKRYAMANIVKADGSEYADIEEMQTDRDNKKLSFADRHPVVILRKVSSHGLGQISAPNYMAEDKGQPHKAVPSKYIEGDDASKTKVLDENGEPILLYGDVCKGKGNPRFILDIWKLAFEQFLFFKGKMTGYDICKKIMSTINQWNGLEKPQFKQRSINTANALKQYSKLPNKRAEMFFNVLPAPERTALGYLSQDWDIVQYDGASLYCQGGHDIDVGALLAEGEVYWQKDNVPARKLVEAWTDSTEESPTKPFHLARVRDALGDYFETQIEDMSTQPFLRAGLNPVLAEIIKNIPGIHNKAGVSEYELIKTLSGVQTGRASKVLRYIRNGFMYNEGDGVCEFNAEDRKTSDLEDKAHKLVSLIRKAYDKAKAKCDEWNANVIVEELYEHDDENKIYSVIMENGPRLLNWRRTLN